MILETLAHDAILPAAGLKLAAFLGVHLRAHRREMAAEARYPLPGQSVTVKGVPLSMKVEGSGPPLVLLHGAGGNLRDFEPLVPQLARHFTVVRFDRPGLGWSGLPDRCRGWWRRRSPSPAEQAALMAEAYRGLGLGPSVILGQSYGGAVALAWALDQPDTAAALVLVSAVSEPWPGRINPFYHVIANPLGALLLVPVLTAFAGRGSVRRTLARIFAPQEPPPGYDRLLGAPLALRRAALRNNARQIADLRGHLTEMSPRYPTLTLPVELLHGECDAIVPPAIHADPLTRAILGSRLVLLPGIGHMPHHAQPDAVVASIERAAVRSHLRPAATGAIVGA